MSRGCSHIWLCTFLAPSNISACATNLHAFCLTSSLASKFEEGESEPEDNLTAGKMMRSSGSSMQYICIYATVCGVTSLLALYGTMEHMKVAKSAKSLSRSSDTEAGNSTTMEAHIDSHLQAIDAKMQLVLQNASLELSRFGSHVTDWDKRQPLNRHNKILLVSSSQARECENGHGDHVLLKALKNKVDYCRLHGLELYYNMDQLDEKLEGWWVKLFVIHMLMRARPDVEWILWLDSDAVFTNMTFEFPLERYKDHNMVLQGYDHKLFKEKSWLGLNTGVILLRNCQWSIDLLHEWVRFSPKGTVRETAGALLTEAFPDRSAFLTEADDQCCLVYLLLTQRSRWAPKVFLEQSYHMQGFFETMMMAPNTFPGMGVTWWPFVAHFTGCQFCCGLPNSRYDEENCRRHLERAYKVANNQVLQHSGYTYVSPHNSVVKPL